MTKRIVFYRFRSKKSPVEKFLDSLSSQDRNKALWIIRFISETDMNLIPARFFKKLTGSDGIWEIRVKGKDNIYRIFSFFFHGETLVLTHGYIKKTQKTDAREIKKAEKYKKDFLQRED
jgi:phage-related protein